MKKGIDNKGFVKAFVVILLVVVFIFGAFSFGKPYFRSYTLGSHTRDILVTDIGNLVTIKAKIMAEANELNVPLDEKNLQVTLDQKTVRVKATWTETVDFFGYYQKKLDFSLNEEY
jgi:hypothetical protein